MNIKEIANNTLKYTINRLIEIFGIIISIIGILLLLALISYSPGDPNFIFSENTEIENLLGIRGSYISDLFLQSVGLISFLVSFTFIFTGINIFKNKDFLLIIENTFFTVLYCIFGSIFLNFFYDNSFKLYINGNGGFVGDYLNQSLFKNIILVNKDIFYYLLVLVTSFLFLMFLKSLSARFFILSFSDLETSLQ